MKKFIEQVKEYGGLGFILVSAIAAGAVSYGAAEATTTQTFANHEKRISTVEDVALHNSLDIAKMSQKIDDLWRDNGHHE